VDQLLATASFSNRVIKAAPEVKGPDCVAPGVNIYSSWPVSMGSHTIRDGTSMAAPHVAGIAALLAQARPGLRGAALKEEVIRTCEKLANAEHRRGEIGAGLAKAS
jgi:subtilisin family serine protease